MVLYYSNFCLQCHKNRIFKENKCIRLIDQNVFADKIINLLCNPLWLAIWIACFV
jgi:hypothetical protein